MRLPLWLHYVDDRTVSLAVCPNCGKVKVNSDPCGFDHLAALIEFEWQTVERRTLSVADQAEVLAEMAAEADGDVNR